MQKIKKLISLQKASLFISIFALSLSIISIISINKLQNIINNSDIGEKLFKPINDIPNVEIVKVDGSVEKVIPTESKDELGKLLNESNKNNNNNKQKERIEKIKLNSKIQQIKKSEKQPIARENKHFKIDIKNNNNTERNINNDKNIGLNQDKKQNQIIEMKNYEKKIDEKQIKQEVSDINGNFVIQIGSFKDRGMAVRQCEKVKVNLNNKKCDVATKNNQMFRSIIYPFETNQEALNYANNLQTKIHITCLVKKNA